MTVSLAEPVAMFSWKTKVMHIPNTRTFQRNLRVFSYVFKEPKVEFRLSNSVRHNKGWQSILSLFFFPFNPPHRENAHFSDVNEALDLILDARFYIRF